MPENIAEPNTTTPSIVDTDVAMRSTAGTVDIITMIAVVLLLMITTLKMIRWELWLGLLSDPYVESFYLCLWSWPSYVAA